MSFKDSRILIVGAGPAGMATALFLAKKGIPSTLIDKATFPRDKICGDGLSGWVVTMLYKIDPQLVTELQQQSDVLDSWGITFYSPNLKHITLPYHYHKRPGEPPGYLIKRKEFDSILMKKVRVHTENNKDKKSGKALINLVEGTEIADADFYPDKVVLYEKETRKPFEGDLVVFADGATSGFAKDPGGIRKEDKHHATGIKVYFKGIQPAKNQHEKARNAVEFYFLKSILPGYLWVFPLANGEANVGLGIRTDVIKKRGIKLKEALFRCIEETPVLKERFAGALQIGSVQAWGLPLGSKKRPVSGDRFLLAGDAASIIDPFTGEGIGNALNSGFHAANHIEKCLEEKRFDAGFNKAYDKRIYDKLWKELKSSRMMQRLSVRPELMNFVMTRASKSDYLQDTFIRMIDDLDLRKKLGKPGFYLKVLFKGSRSKAGSPLRSER